MSKVKETEEFQPLMIEYRTNSGKTKQIVCKTQKSLDKFNESDFEVVRVEMV
jgi:hypothetical protein